MNEELRESPFRWDARRFIEATDRFLTSTAESQQVQRIILESIDGYLQPSMWFLFLFEEGTQELKCDLAVGKGALAFKDARISMGQGIAGWVAEHGEPLVLSSLSRDSEYFCEIDLMKSLEGHSVVAVPLLLRNECLGVIQLIDCVGFDANLQADMVALQEFAGHAATAIEFARYQRKIVETAIVDDLTGLYLGRHLDFILDTELCRSARYGYEFSLLLLEIHRFSNLASSLTHPALGELLCELGQHIKAGLRRIDWGFYRDEGQFALVLPQASKHNATTFADRLRKLIETTSWLARDGLNLHLKAEMGIATCPTDGQSKADLIRNAEAALRG
jgi:diguanylate cyclase (GGDEF)-like protein